MSGPIRGLHDVEGKLFVVSGSTLYQISNTGVAIPLGTIPGTGRVSMAHNQITGGNQLLVVNGSSGYVWNTVEQTFERVVDSSYPGAAIAEFIDGYLVQLEPFGRFILHSDLADALAYNALDRFEAETAPDMTAGLAILHQEVWALGERTIDVFENVGTAQGTFRNKGVSISRGCIARWSTGVIDNGLAWLGDDRVVYHARGYDPARISTRAIEVALSECSLTDIRNAFAFVWQDRGHAVYYITVPNGPTFGYDFSTGLWHRRSSWNPVTDVSGRWRLNDLVRHNGKWIGGDASTGKLYELDWDYMLEGCEPLIRERTTPVAHNNGDRFTLDKVELLFDTGGPEVECVAFPYQPVGPQISGEAPDGLTGEPYTFTYTVTQGSAPIARIELRDTELPDGWAWDEQTATISHDEAPVPVGTIPLQMRVYDTNGLFNDHEDEFLIGQEAYLLVTGAAKGGAEDPVFASAVALSPIEFEGIAQSSGADISGATAVCVGGRWAAIQESGVRYTDNVAGSWSSGALDEYPGGANSFGQIIGHGESWLAVVPSTAAAPTAFVADGSMGFVRTTVSAVNSGGSATTDAQSAPNCILADGKFFLCRERSLFMADEPGGPYAAIWDAARESAAGRNPNGASIVAWYDLAEFEGEWYAVVAWHFNLADRRRRIIKSLNGYEDWTTFDIVVDVGYGDSDNPAQLAAGGGHLYAYTLGAGIWSSANNWEESVSTGLTGPGTHSSGVMQGGRRMAYANDLLYVIGATDTLVTVDPSDLTVSDPITLPVGAAVSISTDYVEPAEDE